MDKTLLIIICVVFIIIILAVAAFILYFAIKSRPKHIPNVIELINSNKKVSLEQINSFLKSNKPSKNELNMLSAYFMDNFKLPSKGLDAKTPSQASAHLKFIELFAACKSADAKMISSLNAELRKAYPSYKDDIEYSEKRGIKSRS